MWGLGDGVSNFGFRISSLGVVLWGLGFGVQSAARRLCWDADLPTPEKLLLGGVAALV